MQPSTAAFWTGRVSANARRGAAARRGALRNALLVRPAFIILRIEGSLRGTGLEDDMVSTQKVFGAVGLQAKKSAVRGSGGARCTAAGALLCVRMTQGLRSGRRAQVAGRRSSGPCAGAAGLMRGAVHCV